MSHFKNQSNQMSRPRRVACRQHGNSQWYKYASYSFRCKYWQNYQSKAIEWYYVILFDFNFGHCNMLWRRMKTCWYEMWWFCTCNTKVLSGILEIACYEKSGVLSAVAMRSSCFVCSSLSAALCLFLMNDSLENKDSQAYELVAQSYQTLQEVNTWPDSSWNTSP